MRINKTESARMALRPIAAGLTTRANTSRGDGTWDPAVSVILVAGCAGGDTRGADDAFATECRFPDTPPLHGVPPP
eukprot:3359278-Pyramimonas_sp.AAC.1